MVSPWGLVLPVATYVAGLVTVVAGLPVRWTLARVGQVPDDAAVVAAGDGMQTIAKRSQLWRARRRCVRIGLARGSGSLCRRGHLFKHRRRCEYGDHGARMRVKGKKGGGADGADLALMGLVFPPCALPEKFGERRAKPANAMPTGSQSGQVLLGQRSYLQASAVMDGTRWTTGADICANAVLRRRKSSEQTDKQARPAAAESQQWHRFPWSF